MSLLDRLRRREEAAPVTGDRWLVVGLGNPEPEYAGTRHNVGAAAVRALAERLGASLKAHKSGVLLADVFAGQARTPLSVGVPTGYMNTCGGPIQRALAFYKLPVDRLVVVHDELDLELGRIRLKHGGGTAGHNGLRDIQRRVGSADFHRVRLGIGRPPGRQTGADYVLRRFPARERKEADVVVARAADAILDLLELGLEPAQNRHHPS